jgi:hypothetical protein
MNTAFVSFQTYIAWNAVINSTNPVAILFSDAESLRTR